MKNTWRIALLLLLAMLGVVGCGDDDDDGTTAASDDTVAEDAGGDDDAAEGDVEAYCDAEVAVETAGEPEIDFETASPDEITAASKTFAEETLLPLAQDVLDAVPEENRENVETLVGIIEQVAETGDGSLFESAEGEAASAADHEFALDQCDWQTLDVTAKNYEYEGIGEDQTAGVTSIELKNEGTELHEIVIIRKNADTTESFEELLQLPEEEAMKKTTFVAAAFAAPGEDDYTVADFEAGDYLAICFIPVGTVNEETHVDGPPHFTQGMKHEFSVS